VTHARLKAIVLGCWAALFVWLLLSGEVDRYIGQRTRWVVIFGAICFPLAALGQAWRMRGARASRATSRDVVGLAVLLAPVLIVALIPAPSLGSLAASRKLSSGSGAASTLNPSALQPGEEITYQELSYAAESTEYAAGLGLSDGYEVQLTGFVSGAYAGVSGALALTRFSIFCCAADAVPFTVPIKTPDGVTFPRDTWLHVKGAVYREDDAWVVEAEEVREVDEPANFYL
jgi:putative membrane protein